MRESDKAYRSLTGKTGDSIAKTSKQELRFGSRVFYLRFQHRFPVINLTTTDRRGLVHRLRDLLLEGLR
jgi:hypothetical protein